MNDLDKQKLSDVERRSFHIELYGHMKELLGYCYEEELYWRAVRNDPLATVVRLATEDTTKANRNE